MYFIYGNDYNSSEEKALVRTKKLRNMTITLTSKTSKYKDFPSESHILWKIHHSPTCLNRITVILYSDPRSIINSTRIKLKFLGKE